MLRDSDVLTEMLNRIRELEANGRSEVTGSIESILFVNLPTPGETGRRFFITDGRKVGEGAGAGTGVSAYDDGLAWNRYSDDTVVAA